MPASSIESMDCCNAAARFLEVDSAGLAKALTSRTTFARGEVIVTLLSAEQAMDVRDAFVKGIYGRVFIWIVQKVNDVIFKPKVSWSINIVEVFCLACRLLSYSFVPHC